MRAILCAGILIFAACGDDNATTIKIGAPCDLHQTAVGQCPGGSSARCLSPGLSCGPGFCSQECTTMACPQGATCVALTVLDQMSGAPQVVHRCFLPCMHDADCGTPDQRLYCDQTYHVCTGGSYFGNVGSTGAHMASGSACLAAPGSPPTPLLGPN